MIWTILIIGFFFSLSRLAVSGEIVIELDNVLYTADVSVLCGEIMDYYSIALPSTHSTVELFCADTDQVSVYTYNKNLELVFLNDVTMTVTVSSSPDEVNENLRLKSFFPLGVGSVPLVSDRLKTQWLVRIVIALQWVVFITSGWFVYRSISRS
jgi:hypothetical protein